MNKSDSQAIERLQEWLKPGDTVYTSVNHVSRSGMSRNIKVYKFQDNQPLWLGYNVALALGWRYDPDYEAVKVSGSGMNMGFHLVYELSNTLFPDGFDCPGQGCPSNDHGNRLDPPENACTAYLGDCTNLCVPWHHRNGGYALHQRWL